MTTALPRPAAPAAFRARLARVLAAACLMALGVGAIWPASSRAQGNDSSRSRTGDYIVAVVNSESVTQVEVNQRLERAVAEARRAGAQLPPDAELRDQVLQSLIDERVIVTVARDTGVRVDEAEVDRAVAGIAAQNQISVAQLRERLKADGLDVARFRATLRDQLMVERLREREVPTRIRISDAEVQQFVDAQRSQSRTEASLNLAQILVTVPEGADAAVVAERRARIEQAQQRLRDGADFAAVAAELSEDARRAEGGAMGLRPSSRLPDLFVQATRDLAVGQVTPEPVRSGAGWHLLKVLQREEAKPFQVTQTHARHILLRLPDRNQADAAVRRMEGLREQIVSGRTRFDALAREVSEDASAAGGGDLGWASPGQFVPEFEEAMNRLAPGQVSAPVVSRFGVHLIEVLERRDTELTPEQVQAQARNQLREQKYEQAYTEWVKELRLRAYVELREPPL